MKCPICKFDMWKCLKDKNIDFSKIKINDGILEKKKKKKKEKTNNLINSNNSTINISNNEIENLNVQE